jgi:hypothetical protein
MGLSAWRHCGRPPPPILVPFLAADNKEPSQKWDAPILDAPEGRRDEFVEPFFKNAKPDQVVAILKGREPARIMAAIGSPRKTDGICRWRNDGSFNTTST